MQRYAVLVVPSGEVVLKSPPTRRRMFKLLSKALLDSASRRGLRISEPMTDGARLIVPLDSPREDALVAASRVFGVHVAALTTVLDFDDLMDLAVKVEAVAAGWVRGKKFAVRVHRYGRHDFTSLDVAREVGAKLRPHSAGVDLENPEVEVYVEVRGSRAYVYPGTRRIKGPGGLPPGSEGKAVVLFSGGIDSPVAAWYAAKRGILVDLLHAVVSSPASAFYAARVASRLAREWLHGYEPRMVILPRFAEALQRLVREVERRLWMLALKLLLYFVADAIASKKGYDAIVTGESVGQTSSQTLQNIKALHAVLTTSVPILRPLTGLDKEELTAKAMEIGVYEEALRTPEYSALVRRGAETRARWEELVVVARRARELAHAALEDLVELNLLDPHPEGKLLEYMPLELGYVPCDALLVKPSDAERSSLRVEPPRPVLVVFDCVDEEARRLVVRLRRRGINAYAYSIEKSGPPSSRRVVVEPGEELSTF